MKLLLLGELLSSVQVTSGQLIVPLEDLELDNLNLEEILKKTLMEYQKYKPFKKRLEAYVDLKGLPIPDATRVVSMRPAVTNLYEFVKPIPFKAYELTDGILTTAYAGKYVIEYIGQYPLDYYDISYKQTTITEFEDQFNFKLKGHFKKGTLNLRVFVNSTTSYDFKEDLSCYKVYPSNFNLTGNILNITSYLGSKLKTGSQIEFKGTSLPSELIEGQIYFCIKISDTQIKIANSIEEAFASIELNLSAGSGAVYSVVDPPYITLLSDIGYGKLNLKTLKVELNLTQSIVGILNISFKSLYLTVEGLELKDDVFVNLFQGNLMMSVGLIKEILKLPDLPYDFSADTIYNRGNELHKEAMETLYDESDWSTFRA